MGLLRLILALSIVLVHAFPIFGHVFFSSTAAVNSFFIISGFYMALILHEKYIGKNGSYRLFITNRFLRIYPLYWVIIVLLFALSIGEFVVDPASEGVIKIMLRSISESTNPLFTGIMMVLRNSTLIFTTDYFQTNFRTPGYLILLAAWTLQIELLFYLLAPFLMKLKRNFIVLLTAFFAWLTFANPFPLLHEGTSIVAVFLIEFVFFLFGFLSYELYRKLTLKHATFLKKYAKSIVIIFFVITAIFGFYSRSEYLTDQNGISFILYYIILLFTIPFLFFVSQKNKLDKSLAALSYPVYVSHFLIFKLIMHSPIKHLDHALITIITVCAVLACSWVLARMIETPIDRLRKNMLK